MNRVRIGIVVAGLALFPQIAPALESAVPVSGVSASSAPRGPPAALATASPPDAAIGVKRADFARETASRDVHDVADWVVDSGDNGSLPFVVIDKTDARVFVFDAGGRIRGAAPALLGLARGDDTVPGIGYRKLSDIRPEERTTPAGRFVAMLGMSTRGEDVLWVDYESGVSLHRVITSNRRERRLERLATPTPADNRISYGCINVPAAFYNEVVHPTFTGTYGVVYILPETRPLRQVFGLYDVEERSRHLYAAQVPRNAALAGALPTLTQ
jgi:hypothetical protein